MPPAWIKLVDAEDVAGLRRWLDKGGNLEDRNPANGNTPLAYAANAGKLEVVKFLLERGADVPGSAAFLGAVMGNNAEIARLLLPQADDWDLRQVLSMLRTHLDDEELHGLVRARLKELKEAMAAKKKKKPTPKPPKKKASPKKKAAEEEDERGPEALAWLKAHSHGLILTSRFSSHRQVVLFVKKLYATGAARVLIDRDYFTEGRPQRFALWVVLPQEADLREKVNALCDQELFQEDADDLPPSDETDSIYLCWDWD
jgi:hypothetical protein